jgi:hypothetical protein
MIVSRSWARHYSADRPAVGRQLQGGGCTTCTPFTIVGVVGDVKYQGLGGNGEAMYVPAAQNMSANYYLFVRTAASGGDAVMQVRIARDRSRARARRRRARSASTSPWRRSDTGGAIAASPRWRSRSRRRDLRDVVVPRRARRRESACAWRWAPAGGVIAMVLNRM